MLPLPFTSLKMLYSPSPGVAVEALRTNVTSVPTTLPPLRFTSPGRTFRRNRKSPPRVPLPLVKVSAPLIGGGGGVDPFAVQAVPGGVGYAGAGIGVEIEQYFVVDHASRRQRPGGGERDQLS